MDFLAQSTDIFTIQNLFLAHSCTVCTQAMQAVNCTVQQVDQCYGMQSSILVPTIPTTALHVGSSARLRHRTGVRKVARQSERSLFVVLPHMHLNRPFTLFKVTFTHPQENSCSCTCVVETWEPQTHSLHTDMTVEVHISNQFMCRLSYKTK